MLDHVKENIDFCTKSFFEMLKLNHKALSVLAGHKKMTVQLFKWKLNLI
jgi:hypothetical protein